MHSIFVRNRLQILTNFGTFLRIHNSIWLICERNTVWAAIGSCCIQHITLVNFSHLRTRTLWHPQRSMKVNKVHIRMSPDLCYCTLYIHRINFSCSLCWQKNILKSEVLLRFLSPVCTFGFPQICFILLDIRILRCMLMSIYHFQIWWDTGKIGKLKEMTVDFHRGNKTVPQRALHCIVFMWITLPEHFITIFQQ